MVLDGGPGTIWTFGIQPPRKRSEAFLLEDFSDRRRTERTFLFLQRFTDLVNRMILLAQFDDQVPSRRLLRLPSRPRPCRCKKNGVGLAAEVMTEDLKRSGRVPEGAGNLAGRTVVDEIGSQGLVHALLGVIRLEKELTTVA
jgi:hypothetical protein